MKKYNRNYYENGIETGVSNFSNYRWIPELTIPMTMTMIDYLSIKWDDVILDYGCAKGYLVKALKWLNRKAIGVDISMYAVKNCDPEIEDRIYHAISTPVLCNDFNFNWVIAKDVFEHLEVNKLCTLLEKDLYAEKMFAIVPLGKDNKYVAPSNNLDKTHIICEDSIWWGNLFEKCGWIVEQFRYKVTGIKDAYYDKYPEAHGFYTLIKMHN